jgi:hypothetical protein
MRHTQGLDKNVLKTAAWRLSSYQETYVSRGCWTVQQTLIGPVADYHGGYREVQAGRWFFPTVAVH